MNPNDPAFKISKAIRDVATATNDRVAIGAAHEAFMVCVGTAAQMTVQEMCTMGDEVSALIAKHTGGSRKRKAQA